MNRVIEVVVSPTGDTTIQTRGYAGGDCLAASRFLEESLGITASERKTAEFYQPTPTEQQFGQRAMVSCLA